MRCPGDSTPNVFDYLWLYWILKQLPLPKDIIHEIIGCYPNRNLIFYGGSYKTPAVHSNFFKSDISCYHKWLKTPQKGFAEYFRTEKRNTPYGWIN
jgi:hypothetical protein